MNQNKRTSMLRRLRQDEVAFQMMKHPNWNRETAERYATETFNHEEVYNWSNKTLRKVMRYGW